MIKNMFKNWKTTSSGLTMIIGSAVHLVFAVKSKSADENTWTISLLAIVAGVGLIFAGDSAVSVSKDEANTSFIKKDETPKP